MITSIRIDDNKRTPFKYTSKIKALKNGSEFIFKPGVNVIVGKNGSGKSTLLNMISKYMLCEKKMCSELPSEALYFPDIFDDDKVLDGISIKSDYIGKVFYLLQQTEMRKDDILDNINNLSLYMNGTSRSSGEKNLHAMNSLFDFVFNQDEYAFPIQKLMEFKKKSNEFWANRIDNLLKYYKDNHVVLMEKDFEYTILMDEPDRNLDIDNIMDLYKVLSFHKPQDAKGRRRSVLMTPAVPERIRVLSPSWYREAVEFQGKPESEQRDFCSWCRCTGGCNLCADISKYNTKGLKIYGG